MGISTINIATSYNNPTDRYIDNYLLPEVSAITLQNTGAGSATFTGFANGTPGRYLIVFNNTPVNQIFHTNSIRSTSGNRFYFSTTTPPRIELNPSKCFTFIYLNNVTVEGVSNQSRWVLVTQ
jgi:hypothetical protein